MMLNKVYDFGQWIIEMMILSFCYIAAVLLGLFITTGPATVAAYSVCFKKTSKKQEYDIIKDFIYYFKANFKQAFLVGILTDFLIYFLCFNYVNRFQLILYNYGIFGYIRFLIMLFLIMTLLYVYPMISYYNAPLKRIMVCSFPLAFVYMLNTLALFIIIVFLQYTIKLTKGFSALFVIGIYFYISSILFDRVFRQHAY